MLSRDFLQRLSDRDGNVTAADLLAAEESLESDARELMPYNIKTCSRMIQEPIRQPVFSCLTCASDKPLGACSACAVACHADHDLIEVFEKRNFVCDCPRNNCSIYKYSDPILDTHTNTYGHNFSGRYCICDSPYDPDDDRVMIQCYVCEDWFHEDCLDLRLSSDDYAALICPACMAREPLRSFLSMYAGKPGSGVLLVLDDTIYGQDTVPSQENPPEASGPSTSSSSETDLDAGFTSNVRPPSPEPEAKPSSESEKPSAVKKDSFCESQKPTEFSSSPPAKKTKLSNAAGHAEPPGVSILKSRPELRTPIYLTEGYKDRWCKCDGCRATAAEFPFLIENEIVYSPPDDPDLGKSSFDLALEALNKLPREQAVQGVTRFQRLSEKIHSAFATFAENGEPVTEDAIRDIFSKTA